MKFLKITLILLALIMPLQSKAEISLDVSIGEPVAVAPPPLPVYVVPEPPEEDFVWAPGHWQWGDYGYFWVPGTWVEPPQQGLLWTPGYWAYDQDRFFFHEGYWGPHVGYYGGINYGGGYDGRGFNGGGWHGDRYVVNRSVTNVNNININNHYQSFNGGPGGTSARPSESEQAFARESHYPPTEQQVQHRDAALNNPQLRQNANHGRPPIAASARPADFSERNVVPARDAGRVDPQTEKYNRSVTSNHSSTNGAAISRQGNAVERAPEVFRPQTPVAEPRQFERPAEPVAQPRAAAQPEPRVNSGNAYSPHSRPVELPQHHQSERGAPQQAAAPQRERGAPEVNATERR